MRHGWRLPWWPVPGESRPEHRSKARRVPPCFPTEREACHEAGEFLLTVAGLEETAADRVRWRFTSNAPGNHPALEYLTSGTVRRGNRLARLLGHLGALDGAGRCPVDPATLIGHQVYARVEHQANEVGDRTAVIVAWREYQAPSLGRNILWTPGAPGSGGLQAALRQRSAIEEFRK